MFLRMNVLRYFSEQSVFYVSCKSESVSHKVSSPTEVEAMHAGSAQDKKKVKEDLIPSVWCYLPVELLEKVLTKLSPSALKTFRQVCKRWKVLIESEEFALKCDSVESTLFVVKSSAYDHYIALPNLATDSWDKHDLEFLSEGEAARFLAADQGLLLYLGYDSEDLWDSQEIYLILQNSLSFKWRRLVVPFSTEGMDMMYVEASLLGGLQVDPGTGNFKVVVAFIDGHTNGNTSITPMEVYIYDSSSNSWRVYVTEVHVLFPQLRHPFLAYWRIGTSIYCGGELYWLVEEWNSVPDPTLEFKTLIKYNITLYTWDMVTVEWFCGKKKLDDLNFASFQDKLFMVNLYDSKEKILLPPEFSHLAPDMEIFDVRSAQRLLKRVGDTFFDSDFKPLKAFAESGNWFLLADAVPGFVDTLLVSNSRLVMPLPRLQCDVRDSCRSLSMNFGTFPASWRLSRKLDSQLASR